MAVILQGILRFIPNLLPSISVIATQDPLKRPIKPATNETSRAVHDTAACTDSVHPSRLVPVKPKN